MKRLLMIIVIFLIASATFAQIKLSGTVKDIEGNPLEMTNLIAINSETKKLDSYAFTDAFGNYKLNLKENSNYIIKASYVGMKTKEIFVNTTDIPIQKNIILQLDASLDEVEIVARMPVTVKGDTIIYNADSFNRGREKKLGDVLENLPGVEVNDKGEIKVAGKTVKKVMVEGKDFFDGDSKLATRNIPADAIDKIEVVKNYSEVRQMSRVTDNEDNVVVNIKLKEGKKKFWFGDIITGVTVATTDFRHAFHPKLFYYSPKSSVNIISDYNNVGKVPFTRRDYFKFTGGFPRVGGRGANFNLTSSNIGFLTLRNNQAKEIDSKFSAVNFSYSPRKTWHISGFGIFSANSINLEEKTIRNYINSHLSKSSIEDSTNPAKKIIKTETTQSLTKQNNDLGLIKLSSIYNPATNHQIDYDVFVKFSKQNQTQQFFSKRSYLNADVEQIPIYEVTRQNPFSINQNVNYFFTLNPKNIVAFKGQYLWQDEDPFYNAKLSELSFKNKLGLTPELLLDVSQNKRIKTNKLDVTLNYYYVLNNKSNVNVTFGTALSSQKFNSDIFQVLNNGKQQRIENLNMNNDVDFLFNDYFTGIHYRFVTGIFTLNQGVVLHSYFTKNTQLGTAVSDDVANVLLPDVSVKISIKKSENVRIKYSQEVNFTDVNKIAQGFVFNNYSSLYSGNRHLEKSISHNINLSYFSSNMFNYTNIFAFLNYNKRINPVKSVAQFNGIEQTSTFVNSAFPDETLSLNTNWSKNFRKYKLRLDANVNYSKSNSLLFSELKDKVENRKSNSFTQNYITKLSSNFRKAINFDIGYHLTINRYNQGGVLNTFKTHSAFLSFDASVSNELILNTKYTYNNYNNNQRAINDYSFWNAELTYQKENSKWEYILEATNLLNTRSFNRNDSNTNFSSTSEYIVQPRFVIFTMRYNL